MLRSKKVIISGVEFVVLAEGNYVTKSEPDKPYKKYKLGGNKVLVVSEKEDFAYFGEDLGDSGIEPGSEKIAYKDEEFVLNASDVQVLKDIEFGEPEGDVEFWDYESGDRIISIGIVKETGKRSDVVGEVFNKNEVKILDSGQARMTK